MELYRSSMPETAYDSFARKCMHRNVTLAPANSISRTSLYGRPITWVNSNTAFASLGRKGPFGVGKPTIAQTCAGRMGKDLLGAALFFSRPGQTTETILSASFPLSPTKYQPNSNLLDEKLCNDPSVLTKAMEVQFQEL